MCGFNWYVFQRSFFDLKVCSQRLRGIIAIQFYVVFIQLQIAIFPHNLHLYNKFPLSSVVEVFFSIIELHFWSISCKSRIGFVNPTPRIGLFVRPSVRPFVRHEKIPHHGYMHQGQRSWIYASFIPASYTHASGSRIIGICIIHTCIRVKDRGS